MHCCALLRWAQSMLWHIHAPPCNTPAPSCIGAHNQIPNLEKLEHTKLWQLHADNITLCSDYYARRTLSFTIGERDPLLATLLDAQQGCERKSPQRAGDA